MPHGLRRRTLAAIVPATFAVAIATAIAATPLPAMAQASYPDKPIRLVLPFAAGGPSDVLGRALGQKLTASMGKPVIVDNKPGA
ncbi:MAG: hypothetical protein H7Z19_00445, partial [Chitinophagaceae bacterium]|nr:hypothetical protein [Rubrivivax sp.]